MELDVVATVVWGVGTIAGFSYAFEKRRRAWRHFRDRRAWRELIFTLALLLTGIASGVTLFLNTFREELNAPPGTTMFTVGLARGCIAFLAILAVFEARE